MITYPTDFVEKCKKVFPTYEDLHYLLNRNDKRVGELLYDAMGFSLDEEQIISMFRNKKEQKILEAAKRAKVKRELYREWATIIDNFAEEMAHRNNYEL